MKVGLAEFEVRARHGKYLLAAGGYGRPVEVVAEFTDAENCSAERGASLVLSLLDRGAKDVAPVIWDHDDIDAAAVLRMESKLAEIRSILQSPVEPHEVVEAIERLIGVS